MSTASEGLGSTRDAVIAVGAWRGGLFGTFLKAFCGFSAVWRLWFSLVSWRWRLPTHWCWVVFSIGWQVRAPMWFQMSSRVWSGGWGSCKRKCWLTAPSKPWIALWTPCATGPVWFSVGTKTGRAKLGRGHLWMAIQFVSEQGSGVWNCTEVSYLTLLQRQRG